MKNSQTEILKEYVHVYCSASKCRFKRDTGYYNLCKNPEVLSQYTSFMSGHVYISGCGKCDGCSKEDCPMKEHQISEVEEAKNELTDELIFYLPKERDSKGGSFSV